MTVETILIIVASLFVSAVLITIVFTITDYFSDKLEQGVTKVEENKNVIRDVLRFNIDRLDRLIRSLELKRIQISLTIDEMKGVKNDLDRLVNKRKYEDEYELDN